VPGKSASTFWDVNELIRNYPHRHKLSASEEGIVVDLAESRVENLWRNRVTAPVRQVFRGGSHGPRGVGRIQFALHLCLTGDS
jgi:hypothetical protein